MVILRLLSLICLVVALMLLGADVVTTLEKGGEFTIRSLDQVLTLVGASPKAWLEATLPGAVSGVTTIVLGWPGWAPLGVLGVVLALVSLRSD